MTVTKVRMAGFTSRNFVGTLCNPDGLWDDDVDWTKIKYSIYQHETAPETGMEHIQAYFVFTSPVRLPQAKAYLGSDTWHLEVRRGTHEQARDYCKKPPGWGMVENGIPPSGGGHRSDLARLADMVSSGTSNSSIADSEPVLYMLHSKKINALREVITPVEKKRDVYVFWGPTGSGKTRAAIDLTPESYVIIDACKGAYWFDGYEGQTTIIIDDFTWASWQWRDLLRFTDRYPYRAPLKGSFTWLKASTENIVFTSNLPPHLWFKYEHFNYSTLERRIDEVRSYGAKADGYVSTFRRVEADPSPRGGDGDGGTSSNQ